MGKKCTFELCYAYDEKYENNCWTLSEVPKGICTFCQSKDKVNRQKLEYDMKKYSPNI